MHAHKHNAQHAHAPRRCTTPGTAACARAAAPPGVRWAAAPRLQPAAGASRCSALGQRLLRYQATRLWLRHALARPGAARAPKNVCLCACQHLCARMRLCMCVHVCLLVCVRVCACLCANACAFVPARGLQGRQRHALATLAHISQMSGGCASFQHIAGGPARNDEYTSVGYLHTVRTHTRAPSCPCCWAASHGLARGCALRALAAYIIRSVQACSSHTVCLQWHNCP